nr:unnamed protein product [Digitaria exilis]
MEGSLEARPGVLLVGAPGVGKRTILSRLLAAEIPDTHDLSSGVLCQGWTIDTKYYSADLSIWTANLGEEFSLGSLPHLDRLAALVMVFDMSDESSLLTLQSWAANVDMQRFEVLLCIGNKADLVPGHGLSVDGDSQGLERLLGALSAHMWPGMILKSGNKITAPSLIEKEESTDDESNYDFEYEVLSHGSDDQWEFVGETSTSRSFETSNEANGAQDHAHQVVNPSADSDSSSNALPSDTPTETAEENTVTQTNKADDNDHVDKTAEDSLDSHQGDAPEANNLSEDEHYGLDDLERLMSEIGNMRSNLRLMPDFQRREMAANLAMKMAAMFGDDDEEAFEDF